jgi:D-alanyl-D-alanine carboxypeptidase
MSLAGTACAPALVKLGVPRIQGQNALDFIAANPSRSALVVTRGDTVLASINADRPMPLASTAKVVIAIEYAYQVAAGEIDENARVPLDQLKQFYVPRYDGGAHESWLRLLRKSGGVDASETVAMQDVVRGMIRQSSNANAEWLLERLGPDRVNARAQAIGIRQGMPLYYGFSSALLILRDAADVPTLETMSDSAWIARAAAIHDSLRSDRTGRLRTSLARDRASLPRQRVWSDRLPSAPAGDYARLADRIASRRYFPPREQQLIESALDGNATAPEVATLGFKGGSSASVFTVMTYILRKDGTRTAYAAFFDGLSVSQGKALQRQAAFWNYLLDTDPDFRERVASLGRRTVTQSTVRDASVIVLPSAESGWSLVRGDRVRLALWPRAGSPKRFKRKREVSGRYAGGAGDTLLIDPGRGRSTRRILARDVQALYHGTESSRLASGSRQAIVSAATGALVALFVERNNGHVSGTGVAQAALLGGAEGVLTGVLRPDVRWRLVSWQPQRDSQPTAPRR